MDAPVNIQCADDTLYLAEVGSPPGLRVALGPRPAGQPDMRLGANLERALFPTFLHLLKTFFFFIAGFRWNSSLPEFIFPGALIKWTPTPPLPLGGSPRGRGSSRDVPHQETSRKKRKEPLEHSPKDQRLSVAQ